MKPKKIADILLKLGKNVNSLWLRTIDKCLIPGQTSDDKCPTVETDKKHKCRRDGHAWN